MNTKRATGKTPQLESLLTQLEYYTDFDSERGAFIIKRKRPRTPQEIGSELGYVETNTKGRIKRRVVSFLGKTYGIHHLVWLWHYGELPTNAIDHINGDPLDNRLSNLRNVSTSLNMRNASMKSNNTSGFTNINWDRVNGKYLVQIHVNSRNKYIGRFVTIQAAVEARDDFLRNNPQLGYTARHGKS